MPATDRRHLKNFSRRQFLGTAGIVGLALLSQDRSLADEQTENLPAPRFLLEWGEHGPSRVTFTGTDKLGRTMQATGTYDPGLIFTGYTDHTVVWSLVEWDWDGVTHWGDNQEFCPAESFRRIARGEIKVDE